MGHYATVIVLHAVWLPGLGRLAVWAEDGSMPRAAPARRGRRPRLPRPRPTPSLSTAMASGWPWPSSTGEWPVVRHWRVGRAELLLRLPATGEGPAASPWLEDGPAEAVTDPSVSPGPLARWKVPGLVLEWSEAGPLLSTLVAVAGDPLAHSTSEPSTTALAADLRFAARVLRWSWSRSTRGRVLPTLEHHPDGWLACWRPVVDGLDRGRIEALRWSLPSAFVAAGAPRCRSAEPATRPDEALRSLMWAGTDALARQLAAGRSPVAGRRRRSRAPGAIDAWLAALVSPDGSVDGDGDELATLAGRLD